MCLRRAPTTPSPSSCSGFARPLRLRTSACTPSTGSSARVPTTSSRNSNSCRLLSSTTPRRGCAFWPSRQPERPLAPPIPQEPAMPTLTTLRPHYPVVVIGGGQAGLSTSHYLQKADIDHVVFEKRRI